MMNFAILALASTASASYLATTTRYYDGQEGACGCGSSSGIYSWQLGVSTGVYTAAGSQALFDTDDATWCGGGCGKCYNLTATGDSACSSCGTGETAGTSIIVMVTNLCPNSGNEEWCPAVGETNEYGYSYHFDIMAESEVFGDNPVVEFEPVTCPSAATTDFEECECYGQLESDETPASMTSSGSSSSAAVSSSAAAATSATTTSAATTTAAATTAAATTSVSSASTSAAAVVSSSSSTTATTFAVSTVATSSSSSVAVASETTIQTSAPAVTTTAAETTAAETTAAATSSAAVAAGASQTSVAAVATSDAATTISAAATTSALVATTDGSCAAKTVRTTTVYVTE